MTFGFLNIDKPSGPTSHDIVAGVRRGLRMRRVGHAGTLDPLATGVLLLAVGEATRLLEYLTGADKTYIAQVTLGITTDTYDAEGEVIARRDIPAALNTETVEAALEQFRGPIEQVPPVYSAVKVDGKSAHARARAGEHVELDARRVTVHQLTLRNMGLPVLELEADVSSGTYIRSLAHDLGQTLGCGAMLSGLRRTAVGSLLVEEAVPWPELQQAFDQSAWEKYLLPVERVMPEVPHIHLNRDELDHIVHGRPLDRPDATQGTMALALAAGGVFVAVVEGHPGRWQPRKVLRKQIDSIQ